MHNTYMYVYQPIPNVSLATKIRLRENFTAEYLKGENIPIYSMLVYVMYYIIIWNIRIIPT